MLVRGILPVVTETIVRMQQVYAMHGGQRFRGDVVDASVKGQAPIYLLLFLFPKIGSSYEAQQRQVGV